MEKARWTTHIGSSTCPQCGEVAVSATHPGTWRRLWRRFAFAEGVGTTLTCGNGHTWGAGSSRGYHERRLRRGRRAFKAVRIFGMVRRSRAMTPFPLTYLMAMVLGVGIGVVVDVLGPVPWWLVTVLVVAAVWLFFMSTAFWGPYRLRRADWLQLTDPPRARTEAYAAIARAVGDGELKPYALVGWSGTASLGGWGRGHGGWHTISLRFRDAGDDRRWVEVETTVGSHPEPSELRKRGLAENLVAQIPDIPSFGSSQEAQAWHARRRRDYEHRLATLKWQLRQIVVNGAVVGAEVASVDDGVAVSAEHDGVVIQILARNVAVGEIKLAPVRDLAPYLENIDS